MSVLRTGADYRRQRHHDSKQSSPPQCEIHPVVAFTIYVSFEEHRGKADLQGVAKAAVQRRGDRVVSEEMST